MSDTVLPEIPSETPSETPVISLINSSDAETTAGREAAELLGALGLFRGVGTDKNGNPDYALDRIPTRHEAIVMLVRLLGKEDEALNGTWETPFHDVAEWAEPYVGYAYAHGLTSGSGADTFSGGNTVTAAQYTTFLLRALGYSSTTDFSWNAPWDLAGKIGLSVDGFIASDTDFTRGGVAQLTVNALTAYNKDSILQLHDKLIIDGVFSRKEYVDLRNGKTPAPSSAVWNGAIKSFTGFGTEDSPYLIECAENLAYLSFMVDAGCNYRGNYFRMTADIDLGMREWEPIGAFYAPFEGIFDGDGHTITNLYISSFAVSDISATSGWNDSVSMVGLFGKIGEAGIVKNLSADGLIDIRIDTKFNKNLIYVGGITGSVLGAVKNCHNFCTISVNSESSNGYAVVGGITGELQIAEVSDCTNAGVICGEAPTCTRVGGIIGDCTSLRSGTVMNCRNTGAVLAYGKTNTGDFTAGGICGKVNHELVKDCFNYGDVYSDRIAGGICGYFSDLGYDRQTDAKMINCTNTGLVKGTKGQTGEIAGILYAGTIQSAYYVKRDIPPIGKIYRLAVVEMLSGNLSK